MKKIVYFSILIIAIIIIWQFVFSKVEKENQIRSGEANILNDVNQSENIASPSSIVEKKYLGLIEDEYKGFDVVAKLEIPEIDLDTYVLENYSTKALNISATKFWGGNPNEIGNFCIAGHNYRDFKNTNKLVNGDVLILTDNYNGSIQYVIYDIYKVSPDQTDCLSQDTNGKKEVTLITCTQDSKKRIILKARQE